MKTIKFIVLFMIAILLGACDIGSSNTYKYFNFYNFFIGKDGNITLEVRYNFDDKNQTFIISQNKKTHMWNKDTNSYPLSNQDYYDVGRKQRFSLDNKAISCISESGIGFLESLENMQCNIEKNDETTRQNLFGDIYNIEYATTLNKYQLKYGLPNPKYYFFDSNNNMHLFYNDTEHAKGKYFNYVMFTEDEPSVPKYEQKIDGK